MKPRLSKQRNQALTLTELLVVIVVVMFLGVCLLSVLKAANKGAKAFNCLNNLKQIGLAHQLWVGDLNNQFPLLSSGADNRPEISTRNDSAYILWQAMSNQLKTPKILVCPADRKRPVAINFASGFGNINISYFVNSDTTQVQQQIILDGDDNLTVGGVPVQAGILNLWTNNRVGWTKDRHDRVGNIGMADGSVQQVTSNGINAAFAASLATNRLAIP